MSTAKRKVEKGNEGDFKGKDVSYIERKKGNFKREISFLNYLLSESFQCIKMIILLFIDVFSPKHFLQVVVN